jgi:hypothetical protein
LPIYKDVNNVDFNITITNQSIKMGLVCVECQCAPEECNKDNDDDDNTIQCKNCIKPLYCCCIDLHRRSLKNSNHSNNYDVFSSRSSSSFSFSFFSSIAIFLKYAKGLYAAALGIEILCIAAAEIGENTGLYLFGFSPAGIVVAYIMGYALAGFTTFAAILGRYDYGSDKTIMKCSCCSVLEQDSNKGFVSNLKTTFGNFVVGIKKLPYLYKQRDLKNILKTSLIILITAETACILTAETVDLIFYKYSILLSAPLALLAGAFTVVAPQAYKRTATKTKGNFPSDDAVSNDFVSFPGSKDKVKLPK